MIWWLSSGLGGTLKELWAGIQNQMISATEGLLLPGSVASLTCFLQLILIGRFNLAEWEKHAMEESRVFELSALFLMHVLTIDK